MPGRFCLDWFSGASAQIELFSPTSADAVDGVYQMKYTPAFRSTIRPPIEERPLGAGELNPISTQLDHLAAAIEGRAAVRVTPAQAVPFPMADIALLGNQMLDLAVPPYVQADLRGNAMFLEIGVDEMLLDYPWELMHDGDDFLCLRHYMGRFVNGASVPMMMARQPTSQLGSTIDELSVLLISVPNPPPRDGQAYERLLGAEREAEAVVDALKNVDGVTVATLLGKKATYNEVYKALKENRYQVVHFCGHASFNNARPRQSGLVLFDRDMTTGSVVSYFGKTPPIVCFINACETARTKTSWKDRYNIYGLAYAFLDTGAYLLGSRWKVEDAAAAIFAREFYTNLLAEQKPLGTAVTAARRAAQAESPDDFAWASYVLYGDPRVCFRYVSDPEPAQAADTRPAP
jgi:hypothetical protein